MGKSQKIQLDDDDDAGRLGTGILSGRDDFLSGGDLAGLTGRVNPYKNQDWARVKVYD